MGTIRKEKEEMTAANVASIVDGKLILTFPDAATPVIWQMDIEKAVTCALEVQEDKKKKLFSLVQKISDSEQNTIASFENKADAVSALMAASSALQSGQGKIKGQDAGADVYKGLREVSSAPAKTKESRGEGLKAAILAGFLIVILALIWVISIPMGAPDLDRSASARRVAGAPPAAGVPMSADEFLSNR